MSDFLGNLVSKNLGLVSILQPRLMSRFEPWRTEGVFDAAYRNVDAALDVADVIERVEADPLAFERETDTATQTRSDLPSRESRSRMNEMLDAPVLEPSSSPESKPELTLQTVSASAPVAWQPIRCERDVSHKIMPPSSSDQSHERHTPVAETPNALALGLSSSPLEPKPELTLQMVLASAPVTPQSMVRERDVLYEKRPSSLADQSVTLQNDATFSKAHTPTARPNIERIERVQESPDQSQVTRLGLAYTSQPLTTSSHTAPGPQSSAPTTIHVTIGRIEVRATPSPTPSRHASQPAPKMSLETYLRSRSGDRR